MPYYSELPGFFYTTGPMHKRIKAKYLKVGMQIVVAGTELSLSIPQKTFTVKSNEDIRTIILNGIEDVVIDTAAGMPFEEYEKVSHGFCQFPASRSWSPDEIVPSDLHAVLADRSLPDQEKASLVYGSCSELMERLMQDPKAENIGAAKTAICGVVDMIITQPEVRSLFVRIARHDFSTYTHSVNVGIFGLLLALRTMQRSELHDVHELGAAFFLHDLGKVRIDPAILNKPGRLNDEEMMLMRTHPVESYQLLKDAGHLSEECAIITMQHHEREDGSGYPKQLRNETIHPFGRICSVADVYDALTADRAYKARLAPFEALTVMKEQMLSHFHADIFGAFVRLLSEDA